MPRQWINSNESTIDVTIEKTLDFRGVVCVAGEGFRCGAIDDIRVWHE